MLSSLTSLLALSLRGARALERSTATERVCLAVAWLVAPVASALASRDDPTGWLKDLRSFERAARWLAPWTRALTQPSAPPPPERTEALVRWAFRAQPLAEYGCLPGAMVQTLLHASMCDPVLVVIGVRGSVTRGTVGAHAWVESPERPRLDLRGEFLPLVLLGSGKRYGQPS